MVARVAEFYKPKEAAAHLGISVASLISLLKEGGYAYTSLKAGSRPWGRGRQFWGMTAQQLQSVVDGQARRFPAAGDEAGTADRVVRGRGRPVGSGRDGRSLLRRNGLTRK